LADIALAGEIRAILTTPARAEQSARGAAAGYF
jgi:hypothetical protein